MVHVTSLTSGSDNPRGRSWGQHRRLFQEDEEANTAGGAGPQWGPAMIRSDKGTINMFYSQSFGCKVVTRENGWTPGGNVLMTTSVVGLYTINQVDP